MKKAPAVACALLAGFLFGCAGKGLTPPPPRAPLSSGSEAMPADLDLVVRIDLERVRSALGPELVGQLRRAARVSAAVDDTEELVSGALEQADVVLLGLRPRSSTVLDHVFVLEGSFKRFDPGATHARPAWTPAQDIGGDFRRWDRAKAPARAAPARIYAFGERMVIIASLAEVDSTERSVELGYRKGALVPPSKGVVSFAARVLPLSFALESRSPRLARWLRAAETLEGSAEIASDGVQLELALKVDSPQTAEQLRNVLQALSELFALRGSVKELAEAAKFETAGNYVVCRAALGRDTLAKWLSCAEKDSPCAW
ncbi:MAG TPA: hypothetical protein VGP93_20205 [Polyangiaceae bacterium]|nr:hypothetical protein [Polyangiaceae bacterium]